MLPLQVIVIFSVIGIYTKTESVLPSAVAMGLVIFLLKLLFLAWWQAILLGVIALAVAYGMFRLAEHFEESIFMRLLAFVFGAMILVWI
jgi:hypothetical protein